MGFCIMTTNFDLTANICNFHRCPVRDFDFFRFFEFGSVSSLTCAEAGHGGKKSGKGNKNCPLTRVRKKGICPFSNKYPNGRIFLSFDSVVGFAPGCVQRSPNTLRSVWSVIGEPWRPYDVTLATRCLTCGIMRLLEKTKSEEKIVLEFKFSRYNV